MNPYASGSIVDLSFHKGGKQKIQFRISIESKVENPLMTIESFNGQFQIGEKEREAVKWEGERIADLLGWILGGILWGLEGPEGYLYV